MLCLFVYEQEEDELDVKPMQICMTQWGQNSNQIVGVVAFLKNVQGGALRLVSNPKWCDVVCDACLALNTC